MRKTCALMMIAVAGASASIANAEIVYGVTQKGFLVNWDSATPGTINGGSAIQGLQNNETLVGIDFRPATGELFALGSFSRLPDHRRCDSGWLAIRNAPQRLLLRL